MNESPLGGGAGGGGGNDDRMSIVGDWSPAGGGVGGSGSPPFPTSATTKRSFSGGQTIASQLQNVPSTSGLHTLANAAGDADVGTVGGGGGGVGGGGTRVNGLLNGGFSAPLQSMQMDGVGGGGGGELGGGRGGKDS